MSLRFYLLFWQAHAYRDYCDSIVCLLIDFAQGQEGYCRNCDVSEGMDW
jgi:hypothetical protein